MDFLLPKFLAGQGPNSSRKWRWNKTYTHFLCRSTMTNSRHHALYFPRKNKMSPLPASFCKRNEQKFRNTSLRFLLKIKIATAMHNIATFFKILLQTLLLQLRTHPPSTDTWERPDRKFVLSMESMKKMWNFKRRSDRDVCFLHCFNLLNLMHVQNCKFKQRKRQHWDLDSGPA